MPILCRVERDDQGIVRSKIEGMAEAIGLRVILEKKGLPAIVVKPGGPGDFRLFLAGASIEKLDELAADLDLPLMQYPLCSSVLASKRRCGG